MSSVDREPRHRLAAGWVLTLSTAAVLVVAALALPRGPHPLPAIARYAMSVALPRWHSTEPVSEVVYGTRGFDTFGETFLLLAAIVGISLLARTRERRQGLLGEAVAGRAEQARYDTHEVTDDDERAARLAEELEHGGGGA